MKKICISLCLSAFLALPAAMAAEFDKLDIRTQDYIVGQLAEAVKDSDIAVLQDRNDEWARPDGKGLGRGRARALGLSPMRFVSMLKGQAGSLSCNDLIFAYVPDRTELLTLSDPRSGVNLPPPYRPLFLADDLVRLVFLKHQREPVRTRVAKSDRDPNLKPFIADAGQMDAAKFMEKYSLAEVFSNSVFRVAEGCVFRIECAVPAMEETDLMRLNKETLELGKAGLPKLQDETGLLALTREEVSEIVFVACLCGGDDGAVKYAEAIRSGGILQPVDGSALKTNIGKKLSRATGGLRSKP